ncbi:RagB/SusD family nutrient uptake outer membrane protein [Pedobacter alpinus]|uniref:RagB/SusD family nutrient uptake outer membrane protein n=1 Tax=Pedobacter alpinus TaxID=1590643 RepID=A0ABW5TXC7_9SPHI
MKKIKYILLAAVLSFTVTSCEKIIEIDPISNVGADAFYRNFTEVNTALSGCYGGLHGPLYNEWMFTELRGDNTKQGLATSSAVQNIEFNELDMFVLNSTHPQVYNYWLATYKNIRAINFVLASLGVTYSNGQITVEQGTATLTSAQKNQIIGEALFLRSYHYFNLVRLFGGVAAVTAPVAPETSKQINRNTVAECFQLITADLNLAKDLLPTNTFNTIANANLGRANAWAAKSLLAKVYLTLNRNSEALPLLNDVINNSGYGLLNSYADVFSIGNEMNREIIFAVRYKAGGLGIGSPFANLFAPSGSGNAVINNDGNGFNFPTESIKNAYITPVSGFSDNRKAVNIAQFTASRPYTRKYLSQVINRYDAENDFPVIRFADVLLMKAEAVGFDGAAGSSVTLINQVRERAGAGDFSGSGSFTSAFFVYPASGAGAITDAASFKTALFKERRLELAFENQRYFDIIRTGDGANVIKNHIAEEYDVHYRNYRPVLTLDFIQSNITTDKLLLPIPQREIDTNDQIVIAQNPGY